MKPLPKPSYSEAKTDLSLLPPQVARIRARILEAARSGVIANLRSPIEWNELPPLFDLSPTGPEHQIPGSDPIVFLQNLSFDRKGAEILRILIAVFEAPYCQMQQGQVHSYVWPAFAHLPPQPVSDEARLAQWACVRFADLAKISADGRPPYYRANIGADGTWHWFWTRGA